MEPNESQFQQPQYQQPQFQQPGGTPPDNYLVWAILATVFCGCIPLGIVSIVKSTQVNTKWVAGDHEGALKASADAKKWTIITAVAGAVCCIVFFIVYFVFLAAIIKNRSGY